MNELQKTIYKNVWNYKNESITKHGQGFTVFFQGDEIYFDTLEQAKRFINEEIAQ